MDSVVTLGLSPLNGIKTVGPNDSTGFLTKRVSSSTSEHCKRMEHNIRNLFVFTHIASNADMMLGATDWLLANINMKGYYRVNYDSENWERLLTKLDSSPQVQTAPSGNEDVLLLPGF